MKIKRPIFIAFPVLVLAGVHPGVLRAQVVSGAAKSIEMRLEELEREIQVLKRLQEIEREKKTSAETREFQNSPAFPPGDYEWLKGLKFSGDFRLRYEGVQQTGGSAAATDRNRFRYRLRAGLEKTFNEQIKVGFRLVSAPSEFISPTRNSTDTTFDSQFAFKSVAIDRAFASYMPSWAQIGPLEDLEITAGKFKNPFEEGSTQMVWDRDVTPEGIYEKAVFELLNHESLDAGLTLLAGQLVVAEGGGTDHKDAELWAYQGGFDFKFKELGKNPVRTKHRVSLFHYRDLANAGNFGAAGGNFVTAGGALAAGNFSVLEFYHELAFQIPGLPQSRFYFDWAKNMAENAPAKALGGGQDNAWLIGTGIGKAKTKGTWELNYEYLWLEANAVPSLFTDSTFGGTNRRGSIISTAYALTDYLLFTAAVYFTNGITTGNPVVPDIERDLYQIDLTWRF